MIFAFSALLSGIISAFHSCKKENDYYYVEKGTKEFVKSYNSNLNKFIGTNISFISGSPKTRDSSIDNDFVEPGIPLEECTTIYFLYPEETIDEIKDLYEEVVTIQDLSDLIRLTGAVMQYTPNNENKNYKLLVSESKIIDGLNPMIKNAKQYLYAKGFTEEEIQEMIIENNAQEIDLVAFVLTLSEMELSEAYYGSRDYRKNFNLSTMLFTPSYAKDVTYSDYLDCAIRAIGLDLISSSTGSTLKSWSKFAIKKAFPVIIKRALGPIGVAIAVASFSYCLYHKYQNSARGDCVYAIPTPSNIETAYEDLINLKNYH